MAEIQGNHAVKPVPGSARQLNGEIAFLMNPDHYPVEAICATCGRPCRLERYYLPMWEHIERFTPPAVP